MKCPIRSADWAAAEAGGLLIGYVRVSTEEIRPTA
jgi:hypothetical protein